MRYATLFAVVGWLWAQPASVGGDACGYRWYTHLANVPDSTPTFSWVDTSQVTNPQFATGLGDDNYIGPISLPFSFVYYWNSYTKLYVGSNGYITFGRGATVASGPQPYFTPFPSTAPPNEWIGIYVADLTFTDASGNPVPGAKLWYGTDTQGRFVITWDSVPYWNQAAPGEWSGRNSFQLIFNPSDSSITFQYKQIDAGYSSSYNNGNFNVVGMENITGQSGLNIAAAWPVPFSNYAIKIWHPRTFTCTSTDAQADWALTERGEAIFALKNGSAPSLRAGLLNTGNQTISNQVRSVLRIQGPGTSATTIYSDTVLHQPPIASGAALASTYTKPLNTATLATPTGLKTGSYRATHFVNIVGGGDGYAGNNQYQAELVVCDSATSGPTQGRYLLRYDDGTWDPQNDGLGGVSFASGMTFVAPQDLLIEAISVDMLYEVGGANNYNLAIWVYDYDPASGAVGSLRDSIGLDVLDFDNGDSLNAFSSQGGGTFILRRYTIPLSNSITLNAGSGLAVGFRTLAPSTATNIGNYVVGDASIPISRRALEGIAGIWAPARDVESDDYAIGLVARLNTSTSMPVRPVPSWEVVIFPNPASSAPTLRYDLPEAKPLTVRIVDLQGRLLYENTFTPTTPTGKLSLPSLSAGTYLVGVTYDGWTKAQRLVMQ